MFAVHLERPPRLRDRRDSSDQLSDQHVPKKRGGHQVAAEDAERPKQKRNKPTLNCLACVQRKTKCDRGKPVCLACQRRETNCVYRSKVQPKKAPPEHVLRLVELSKCQKTGEDATSPETIKSEGSGTKTPTTLVLRGSSTSAEPLLTKVPYATFSATNVYSVTTEHPFTNYWTLAGGRNEVLTALPSKEQADILIAKYFDSVDSIFPFPHYPKYQDQYDEFWSLSDDEKAQVDPDFLGLLFVKLALGAQFVRTPGDVATNQAPAAELYASACQQCLHLSGYLHHTSILTLRSMNLMTYYLTNANRTPDSWAFGGIEIRQSYAMGINRDASRVQRPPEETVLERHQRRRLWEAMVALDASKATVLKMPPSTTHGDQPSYASDPYYDRLPATNPAVPMDTVLSPFLALAPFEPASDTKYTEDMYALGLLAQEFISSPRSLGVPIAPEPFQRNALLAKFQACHDAFPPIFRTWTDTSLADLCATGFQGRRTVRQIFLLTGHYWYYIMLIYAEGSDQRPSASEELVKGCLIAAHEALRPFFVLPTLLEGDAGIWWLLAHRAFAAATTMANLLRHHEPSTDPISSHWRRRHPWSSQSYDDETMAMFTKARVDIESMLAILRQLATHDEVSRERVETLERVFYGERDKGPGAG